jgi:mannosyltransferase
VLLVASPWASRWAQDARPFALVTLAAVVSTLALLAAASGHTRHGRPARRWVWYALSVVVLGLLNVLALLLLMVHLAVVLATHSGWVRRRWSAAVGAGLVLLAPFLVVAFGQRDQVSWIPRPRPYDLLVVFLLPFGSRFVLPVLAMVVFLLAGWIALRRRLPDGAAWASARLGLVLAASWAVLPPLVLWSVSQLNPLWDAHYVLYALPGLALLAGYTPRAVMAVLQDTGPGRYAAAPTGWARRLPGLAAGGLVVVVTVLGLPAQLGYRAADTGHGEDIRGVADTFAATAQPGDAVLYAPYKLRVIATIYPDRMSRLDDVALASSPVASGTIHGVEVSATELAGRLAGHNRVWLVHGSYLIRTPQDQAKLNLPSLGYRLAGEIQRAGYTLSLYQRTG